MQRLAEIGARIRELIGGREMARREPVLFWRSMPIDETRDFEFMEAALEEARKAAQAGEVPVGAAIVIDGRIAARAGNRTIRDCDPTAHAEMVVLRETATRVGNYRLSGATMYVTIEPCAMCAGAMIQARIERLVFGADDAKGGAARTCFSIFQHPRLNHRVEYTAGVRAEEAASILKGFFEERR
jgi:tRNA(adenine34) deaminase